MALLPVSNGGARVYSTQKEVETRSPSLPTSLYSTNLKAETEATKTGAAHKDHSTDTFSSVVFFADDLCILQDH